MNNCVYLVYLYQWSIFVCSSHFPLFLCRSRPQRQPFWGSRCALLLCPFFNQLILIGPIFSLQALLIGMLLTSCVDIWWWWRALLSPVTAIDGRLTLVIFVIRFCSFKTEEFGLSLVSISIVKNNFCTCNDSLPNFTQSRTFYSVSSQGYKVTFILDSLGCCHHVFAYG